jgi:hypothetical protein
MTLSMICATVDWGGGGGVMVLLLLAESRIDGEVSGGLERGGIPEVPTEGREFSEDLRWGRPLSVGD